MMQDRPQQAAGWVAIQRNPASGSGGQRVFLQELAAELIRLKLRPRVFAQRERLARWLSDPVLRESLICVVAAGGDGTFRDVFNRYPGCKTAILPLGTENLVARHLHVPKSGKAVAEMIAAGETRRLDLATCGDRKFAVMASVGFDADVIRRAHENRTGHIQRFNYLQPIYDSLRNYDYPDLRVWVEDRPEPLTAKLVVAVNLPAYALGLNVATHARGDDGLLDVRLFQTGSSLQLFWYFCHLLCGRHEELPDVLSFPARSLRIESEKPAPVQVDGDPAGFTPVDIRVLPQALEVIVPGPEPEVI